jgi:hypothetical protein
LVKDSTNDDACQTKLNPKKDLYKVGESWGCARKELLTEYKRTEKMSEIDADG